MVTAYSGNSTEWNTAYELATNVFVASNMTTVERDLLSALNGMIIYNTTTNLFNFYENSSWVTK